MTKPPADYCDHGMLEAENEKMYRLLGRGGVGQEMADRIAELEQGWDDMVAENLALRRTSPDCEALTANACPLISRDARIAELEASAETADACIANQMARIAELAEQNAVLIRSNEVMEALLREKG